MNNDPKRIRRDEAKLDMLDGIEEEIVHRNTEKRITLMAGLRRKKRKKILLPTIASAACFLLLASAGLLLFLKRDTKQVPIYQGMTVSSNYRSATLEAEEIDGVIHLSRQAAAPWYAESFVLENDPNLEDEDEAGENGDSTDTNTDVGADAGTDTETDSETQTEAETEPPFQDVGAASELYYAKANQEIYITIHFSNPDNFEIMSFTLNGKKYSSYMFEEGSDMENLVLKQQVGGELGIEEFTIDAIKYVDGTEIKDVRMEGDRTVRVGVYEKDVPALTASNPEVGFYSVSAAFQLEDVPTLFSLSGAYIRAVLYEGAEKLAVQDLLLENMVAGTTVTFDGLKLHSDYRMILQVALPNKDTRTIWEKTFRTKGALSIENLTAGKEDVSFELAWEEDYPTKEVLSIKIYEEETLVKEMEQDARVTGGLLSGHTYRLELSYRDGEGEDLCVTTFTTEGKREPSIVIEPTSDQTSIDFEVTVDDPDSLCTITKIELLHGEDAPVVADNTDVRSFEGLLSNNDYTVRITYTYDLNDGEGVHTRSATKTIRTYAKRSPAYVLTRGDGVSEQSLSFALTETDADNIGTVKRIELLKDDAVVATAADMSVRLFEGLDAKTLYVVRVTYEYDLNDGVGVQTGTVLLPISTKMVRVTDISISGNSVVKPGDTVTLVLAVNDSNVTVTHAVINGVRCELQRMGNKNYRVQYTSTSEGGKEILCCTELTYTSGKWTLSEPAEFTSAASLLIQGAISIESLTLSQDGEYFIGDDQKATIVIRGADGYSEIKALKIYDSDYDEVGYELQLMKVNGNTYTFTLPSEIGARSCYVRGIVCDVGGSESDVFFDQEEVFSYIVMESSYKTVIDISTAEQLQNMQSGKAYRLVADIDLEDFRWVPYDFDGVLYGNGYKIKNLYLYRYYRGDETVGEVRGMFGEFHGYMKDVVLENASITIEKNGAFGYHEPGDMPVGLLAGDANGLMKGCAVKGTLTVIIDGYGAEASVGGVVGNVFYRLILDGCSFEVTMEFNRGFDPMHIGFVVGRGGGTYIRCDSSKCQYMVNGQPYSPWQ